MSEENSAITDHRIGKLMGGYEITELLGAGGMGSVYKAYDKGLDRFVALKLLAPALGADPTCVQRFQREARSIASIRHPNLMHIYSVGEEEGVHFFAMEYIQGISLSQYISSHKKLSVEKTILLASQVMSALHKVHEDNIIHRDLKPGNVMIDSDGRAILVDFGLSKDNNDMGLTGTGTIMGTPDYMAPEQIEGEPVGPFTDIYSLGVVIYEMLTGLKPFHRKSAIMTMRAHCENRPPLVNKIRQDIPANLAVLIDKAMAYKSVERFSNIPEMAASLNLMHSCSELEQLAKMSPIIPDAETIIASDKTIQAKPSGALLKSDKTVSRTKIRPSISPETVKVNKNRKGKSPLKRKTLPTGKKISNAEKALYALIAFLLLMVFLLAVSRLSSSKQNPEKSPDTGDRLEQSLTDTGETKTPASPKKQNQIYLRGNRSLPRRLQRKRNITQI